MAKRKNVDLRGPEAVIPDVVRSLERSLRRAYLALAVVGVAFLVLGMVGAVGLVRLWTLERKPQLFALSPSGFPIPVASYRDRVYQTEIKAFVREAVERAFSVSYDEFLTQEGWRQYAMRIAPFFDRKYLNVFLRGLQAGLAREMVRRRVVIAAEVVPPVEVTKDQKTGDFLILARLAWSERSPVGVARSVRAFVFRIRKTERTEENPWGLRIVELRQVGSGG
ncbi:hypothetical protein [Thermosulfurimonas sp. F29]|uniref:hypothetical protein n=1 Tax=Thermosulfurimonas sp. F29 TaxID=2867247 RepID=UPI001C834C02|nr:hypothetical protein [Thermosulfurimonas sp. F29]MBX6424203.1 hypothetical protein [Thermosulfurimonas sp. F29]